MTSVISKQRIRGYYHFSDFNLCANCNLSSLAWYQNNLFQIKITDDMGVWKRFILKNRHLSDGYLKLEIKKKEKNMRSEMKQIYELKLICNKDNTSIEPYNIKINKRHVENADTSTSVTFDLEVWPWPYDFGELWKWLEFFSNFFTCFIGIDFPLMSASLI